MLDALTEAGFDLPRAANASEVMHLRRETRDLNKVVADYTFELRLLKKLDRRWRQPLRRYLNNNRQFRLPFQGPRIDDLYESHFSTTQCHQGNSVVLEKPKRLLVSVISFLPSNIP